MRRSIAEPLRQIAANAGEEGSIVVQKVRDDKGSYGYNAATNEYGDLIAMGVIDSTKVGSRRSCVFQGRRLASSGRHAGVQPPSLRLEA